MATRSLNKVQLIGNLTRDPELRYTPQGTAICTFGLATNRTWTTDTGDKRESTEFHRIVAWNKLAELCAQLLFKGRKVFVEGRLQTRQWTAQDGTPRRTTESVISDMIILDSKRAPGEPGEGVEAVSEETAELEAAEAEEEGAGEKKSALVKEVKKTSPAKVAVPAKKVGEKKAKKGKADEKKEEEEEVKAEDISDDIPF